MKIKDRNRVFNLWFEKTYSITIFVIVVSFAFINYIVGLIGFNAFGMMSLFLINFIFLLVAFGWSMVPDNISENKDTNKDENKRDLYRSLLYTTIYTIITLGLYYSQPKSIPKPEVSIHKKITSVKFVDFHHNTKDSYAIRYFDKDGNNVFTDDYTKEADRTLVYNKIFKDGKVVVEMDYFNKNGKKRVDISQKPINLN